jgi:hypothetical protein
MELQGGLTLEADDFVCSYLRFSACYEDNNTIIRFSETITNYHEELVDIVTISTNSSW